MACIWLPRLIKQDRSRGDYPLRNGLEQLMTSESGTHKRPTHRWSKHVTETSDAMDLDQDVFKEPSARQIAASLKRSAEHSKRRKSNPFRSAMSMLSFYMNRAGRNLSPSRKRTLNAAKDELRRLFRR
jgi:type IV secretory pathway VirB10-like protein